MKSSLFTGLIIGGLCGGLIGFSIRPAAHAGGNEQAETEAQEPSAASTAVSTNAQPVEKELLLLAIDELNLTSAELGEAQEYIAKLERGARRYNWLTDYWKEHGTSRSWELQISHKSDPRNEFIEFMGWDEQTAQTVKALGQDTNRRIKEWETANAAKVESDDPDVIWSYELPAMPEQFGEDYLFSMQDFLADDDYALISRNLEKPFENLTNPRTITMTYTDAPAGISAFADSDQQWVRIEERAIKNDGSPGFGSTHIMQYRADHPISHSWNHITGEETQSESYVIYQ